VISYSVTRRTREIGIRMALGAERTAVLWLVARHAAVLVLAGAAIGIPAALALSKLVKSFLYGVGPQDTTAIAASLLALLLVAAVASAIPARRATQVDPHRSVAAGLTPQLAHDKLSNTGRLHATGMEDAPWP
jgi:ABC-type antimicrobial peptide transport system permease subunit